MFESVSRLVPRRALVKFVYWIVIMLLVAALVRYIKILLFIKTGQSSFSDMERFTKISIKDFNNQMKLVDEILMGNGNHQRSQTSGLDDGSRILEDKGNIFDAKSGILGDNYSIFKDKNSLMETNHSIMDDKNNLLGDKDSISDDKSGLLKDKGGIKEDEYNHLNGKDSVLEDQKDNLQDKRNNKEVPTQHSNKKYDDHEQDNFPYRYLINERTACQKFPVHIMNIVPISASSFSGRALFRKMWVNETYQQLTSMKTLFMVAVPKSSEVQRHIDLESHTYHDIIQMDFIDHYYNLTLKTLSILHWTKHYCPEAKWILKSDEDIFVNPFALREFLKYHTGAKTSFVCRMNRRLKVCRLERDCDPKWIIPKSLYPDDYYPPYCNGPAYVMRSSLAGDLLSRADKKNPFIMEDAYVTGILAQPLNPEYRRIFATRFPSRVKRLKDKYHEGRIILLTNVEKVQGRSEELWNRILQFHELIPPAVTKTDNYQDT